MKKKSSAKKKYSKKTTKSVSTSIKRAKKGSLKIGKSNKKVKSKKQAIAIGISKARRKGAKAPKK